jgi:hypothetical protein
MCRLASLLLVRLFTISAVLAAQGAAQGGGGQDRDTATSGGGEPARQRNWEETWWKRR